MKCSRCGRKNKAGAIVCRNCGAALIPPVGSVDETVGTRASAQSDEALAVSDGTVDNGSKFGKIKNKLSESAASGKWKWALVALAVAALAALAIVIIAAVTSSGLTLPGSSSYTVLRNGDSVSVVYGGKSPLPGVEIADAKCSADASTVGIINTSGMLYCCRNGVGSTVDADTVDLTVSDNGSYLFYTDTASRLWAYKCAKSGALPVCVCSEAVSPGYAVSCDGKYVVYNKLSDGALYLCTVSNGKEQRIGEGLEPVSVSNGAKYIYAYKEEDCSLYLVNKNGNSTYIRGGIGETLWLNYDHNEIVFTSEATNGNVKTMLFKNGREYDIAGTALSPVFTASMRPTELKTPSFTVVTCPWRSFEKRIFCGNGLYSFSFDGITSLGSAFEAEIDRTFIGDKDDGEDSAAESKPTEGGISSAVLSDDSKHLYFILNGGLYHSLSSDYSSCEKLYGDCCEIMAAKNGTIVWFTDASGALFCCTGSKIEKAADNAGAWAISPNGREAIYTVNGTAYYCKSSSPASARELCDGVSGVAYDRKGMYVLTGGKWQGVTSKGVLTDLNDE